MACYAGLDRLINFRARTQDYLVEQKGHQDGQYNRAHFVLFQVYGREAVYRHNRRRPGRAIAVGRLLCPSLIDSGKGILEKNVR